MDDIVPGASKSDAADRANAAIVRSIVRAARVPLVALDSRFRVVGANAAFAKLLSTTKRALLGQAFGDRLAGHWNESGLLGRIAAVRTEKASMRDVECTFDTGLGDRRLHRLNARRARASDPNDDTILLTIEDITDERQAANELRFTNAVLTAQMEGSPDGILVVDENARIVSHNRRFLEVWNVPPSLIKTKVDDPVLAYATAQTKDPETFLARVRYLYEHPEETARDEIELADGRIIDRHTSSLRDETGKYLGRVWFFRDVTKQRWTEAAIRDELARAQTHSRAIETVSRSDAVISGEVELLARQITELASAAVGCERVNVWLFNDDESELTCIDSYEATPGTHSSGMVLRESQYRGEFQALKAAPYVDADDPLTDPRTAGYVEGYIKPLGITSMLDTVIVASGKNMGILCFEHVGKPHRWQKDEIEFAGRLADKIGLALVSRKRRRAEEKIRASADALAEAQAIAHVGNWSLDCKTNAIEWSEEVYRIFGLERGTFAPSYDAFLNRIHPDDRAKVDAAYRESVAARRAYEVEHRIVMSDGSIRFVRERGRSTYSGDNRPVRSVGTVQDITERKWAEETLRASRDLLHTVIESAPVRIFWKDIDLRYLGCNTAFARDAGMLHPEDLIGKDDFQMGWRDQAELYRADDRRVMESGTPVLGYEEPQTTPDGSTIWLRTSKVPLRDDAGKVMGILGVYEDITERKRAEESLRIANAIVDASPTVLFRCNMSEGWPITYVSPNVARAFGYRPEELTAPPRPAISLIHPDDVARVVREVDAHVTAGRTTFVQEYRLLDKSGEARWVEDATSLERDAEGRVVRSQGTVIDITERKRAEDSIKEINRVLRVLSAGNAALVQASDEAALLAEMCRILVNIGGYRMAWIGFAQHDDAKTVRPLAHAGHDEGYLDAVNIVWADTERGRGPTGTAIRTGTPQVNRNVAVNPVMTPWREAAVARGFASSIALPLKNRSGTFGALTIYAAEPDAFDADEVKLLVELSDDLSYGISALRDRAQSEVAAERLQCSMETTIEVVAGTVEQRDPYTAGHQRRVAILAEAMARRMGLAEDRIHGLRLAGIVHDLGKIYIPAEILSKPSRLTAVEYEMIKSHPQIGYDILKNVDFPWPIAKMVVQHHERMDGTGYPNGLKGEDIILESRILAVADVVESMMSHRPYRPSRGIDVALAEIEQGRGTAYDTAAVDACLTLFREDGFAFD